jgi:hypothetical protein
MANAYWVATFEVPRGHNQQSVVLKPGVRINRVLEWKVDVANHGFIMTALMEKQTLDQEPEQFAMDDVVFTPSTDDERVAP